MNQKNLKIGIFGGTFDPVHNGHKKSLIHILNNSFLSQIYICPCFHPPHKNLKNITSFKTRLKLLDISFKNKEKIIISDVEKELTTPTYTYKLMNHLKNKLKTNEVYLIIGSDIIKTIHLWKNYKSLIKENKFILINRSGYNLKNIKNDTLKQYELKKLKENFIETPRIKISSSHIKKLIKQNKNASLYLDNEVYNYIKTINLYS